ncbi:MAG: hypothetical protein Lokiarch_46810 [Candidatus Lokiarchaeum sp. GC14_75]|nr:MAG: hypothetical protein Lokiarch_46810 [Candidatus Lokiarchaeum sp. GC14_75]
MSYDLDWLKNEKSEKIDIQEEKNQIKIQDKKIAPEPEKKIDSLIEPKKLEIGSEIDIDLKLLTKPLKRITGSDISNINITQDDLWLLYRLKFGKSTRTKRNVL